MYMPFAYLTCSYAAYATSYLAPPLIFEGGHRLKGKRLNWDRNDAVLEEYWAKGLTGTGTTEQKLLAAEQSGGYSKNS